VEVAAAFVIASAVLLFVFARLQRARRRLDTTQEPTPRKSRRQRKLEQIREFDPLPEPKSVFDIMMEEAAELGLDAIPGGEGLEVPVKLKVWRRDAAVREACAGAVRFELADGVAAETATVDDVRLVCPEPAPTAPSGAGEAATQDDDEPAATEAPAGDDAGQGPPPQDPPE
jgi:hypothetical protein